MAKPKSKSLICKRCKFGSGGKHGEWVTRPGRLKLAGRKEPVMCPRCHSRAWNKPVASKKALRKKAA